MGAAPTVRECARIDSPVLMLFKLDHVKISEGVMTNYTTVSLSDERAGIEPASPSNRRGALPLSYTDRARSAQE